MIPFTARPGEKTSYVFFCGRTRYRLKEVLEDNMTQGWEMLPLAEAEGKLPQGTEIPIVYTRPDATKEDGRPCPRKGIWVFISRYDAEDIKDFMVTVFNHPETLEKHRKVSQEYFREENPEEF